ncbi:MAG: NAD-dependent epimerase/dehydratase family protein [Streptosporangiaceae bacterium]
MEKRHVVVTGAAGLLGVDVITQARKHGLRVVAIDDGSAGTWQRLTAFQDDEGVRCCRIDICDLDALADVWPANCSADVVHLAARHFIPDCQANPSAARRINIQGTANVLTVAEARAARRFILASTADVYAAGNQPHGEDGPVAPVTVYAQTKARAESLVAVAASGSPRTSFLCARLFNLYGPDPTVEHLIPAIIKQATAGELVRVGNLDSIRDYVYVEDAARALTELLSSTANGALNVGTGVGTNGHRVVRLVGQILQKELTVVEDAKRMRDIDRPTLVASPRRLCALLPWWPATSLEEGLARVLKRDGSDDVPETALPGIDEQTASVVPCGRTERGGAVR